MPDQLLFREVMGTFPTGVTVVATRNPDGQPVGLTVNSFTSVSLDPPLVLVCIDRGSSSHDRLVEAGSFTVNILAAEQESLAARFAVDPAEERFADIPWSEGPGGTPVLGGVTAWLACTLQDIHLAGDHSILVARVDALHADGRPSLLFSRGGFGVAGP